MTVTAEDGTPLAGTLTLPAGPGPHPAVLLLHGSGPLDREGNTRKVQMNLGRPLAAALAAEGLAVLRYDRRGAGATPGAWRATGFTDNYKDAAAALRALAEHPAVRPDTVGVIGHSEGALHAMSLAARQDVGAVVLLAGYARPGEEALRWQARSIIQGMPAPVRLLRRPLGALGNRALARIKRTRTDVARVAGFPVNARWMRENLAHDTRDDLTAVHAPVLAVTGAKDLQVDPADLDEMHRLVPGGAEIHRIPDLTHILRRDPGRHTLRAYRRLLRDPVDPGLLNLITAWLARQLGAASGQMRAEGRTLPS
ncbi:acyl-CoA thioester hydrolase [Streptomyces rapamycinicus NRRL 5491]|uniref:Acyl-CoA thioester hydrolase n=2 Tax=Streptomyces rapamycinicus TaxID=1226757 RepID=A0A3L8RKK7_STRRN|nr:acyl-CoA thioester hydrolase [Streptomyces rapamycinicus NRRL 5491]